MRTIFLFTILLFQIINGQQLQQPSARFYEIRHWKFINFTWPDFATYQNAIASNEYVPENVLISGIKQFDGYFYVTMPRMKSGVPATLARIPTEFVANQPSPDFEPYPSWMMNTISDHNNCDHLQNVQNIEIDADGRMWIIDVGRVQTLGKRPQIRCQPKLIIYDIRADRMVKLYQFPEEVAMMNSSFLYDLVVDNTDGGYAYITDNSATDPGIIVYSLKDNRSWKFHQHRSMFGDLPNFVVNNITIPPSINIVGIALGPHLKRSVNDQITIGDDRQVYFSPLSSKHLYTINTTILRNENSSKLPNLDGVISDVGLKLSPSAGMLMDNRGVLYYGLLEINGIGVWDSSKDFRTEQQLIAKDPRFIEWPNSFTFDTDGNLIVLINRLNRFIFGQFDHNVINFRLISAKLGGKSYIYDEDSNYIVNQTTSTTQVPLRMKQPTAGFNPLTINNLMIVIIVVFSLIC